MTMEVTVIISFVILNICTGIIAYKCAVNRMTKVMEFVPVGTVQRLERHLEVTKMKINDLLEDLENANQDIDCGLDDGEIQGTTIEELRERAASGLL